MSSILKAAMLGIIIFCVTILLLVPVALVFAGQDDVASTVIPIEEKARNVDSITHYTGLPLEAEGDPLEFYHFNDNYNWSKSDCPGTCETCFIGYKNRICDEELNNEMCEFDGGDCEIAFCDYSVNDCLNNPLHQQGLISCENDAKPCSGLSWENCSTIGDNFCDVNSNFNSEECGFDGGDCQPNICFSTSDNNDCLVPDNVPCYWYKDGHCDAYFNKSQCCFDGGDCGVANSNTELCDATVNEDYCFITFEECVNNPAYTLGLLSCEELDTCFTPPWTSCSTIGDGQCDLSLNTKECYFDGGDCQPMVCIEAGMNCIVESIMSCEYGLGDGFCDDELNTEECNFDHGDCIEDGCPETCDFGLLDFSLGCTLIGNGFCDERLNIASCNYDGGDCFQCPEDCNYPEPWLGCWEIGNGFCTAALNVSSCYFDGGDCKEDDFGIVVSMKDRY